MKLYIPRHSSKDSGQRSTLFPRLGRLPAPLVSYCDSNVVVVTLGGVTFLCGGSPGWTSPAKW